MDGFIILFFGGGERERDGERGGEELRNAKRTPSEGGEPLYSHQTTLIIFLYLLQGENPQRLREERYVRSLDNCNPYPEQLIRWSSWGQVRSARVHLSLGYLPNTRKIGALGLPSKLFASLFCSSRSRLAAPVSL
jgi:hypothetical protein